MDEVENASKWVERLWKYRHIWKIKRLHKRERLEYERLCKVNRDLWEAFLALPQESMAYKVPFHPYRVESEHQPLLLKFLNYLDDITRTLKGLEWPDGQIDKFPLAYQRRRGLTVNGAACVDGLKDQDNLSKLALDQKVWSKFPRLMRVGDQQAEEIISPPPR